MDHHSLKKLKVESHFLEEVNCAFCKTWLLRALVTVLCFDKSPISIWRENMMLKNNNSTFCRTWLRRALVTVFCKIPLRGKLGSTAATLENINVHLSNKKLHKVYFFALAVWSFLSGDLLLVHLPLRGAWEGSLAVGTLARGHHCRQGTSLNWVVCCEKRYFRIHFHFLRCKRITQNFTSWNQSHQIHEQE